MEALIAMMVTAGVFAAGLVIRLAVFPVVLAIMCVPIYAIALGVEATHGIPKWHVPGGVTLAHHAA